jgi:hypothetical protein
MAQVAAEANLRRAFPGTRKISGATGPAQRLTPCRDHRFGLLRQDSQAIGL